MVILQMFIRPVRKNLLRQVRGSDKRTVTLGRAREMDMYYVGACATGEHEEVRTLLAENFPFSYHMFYISCPLLSMIPCLVRSVSYMFHLSDILPTLLRRFQSCAIACNIVCL
jgi:hypothetical protein